MNQLRVGMRVCDVRGHLLGHITALDAACFELRLVRGDSMVRLKPDVVFTVESERATLVCEENGLDRYACADVVHHVPPTAEPTPLPGGDSGAS